MSEIVIAGPLSHQVQFDQSRRRFKVGRCGRRWGKTTEAFKAAITGHGPGWPENPMYKGVAHGQHVYWIAPDYPQAGLLWNTEIVPRLSGIRGVRLNNSDHEAWFPNRGALLMRSAENIRAVRGSGALLAGVVLEEAAHWDCESGWQKEVLPALTDNDGWALFISTTNGGNDGHVDEAGNKITPSFFNRLCQEIQSGLRDPEIWEEFHGTAKENPRIGPDKFAVLVSEYTEGSVDLQQEVFAALVEGGVGKVFTCWRPDLHVVDWPQLPQGWRLVGASLDPGFRDALSFGLWAVNGEGDLVRWDEVYVRHVFAEDAGRLCAHKLVQWNAEAGFIYCDTDLFKQTGVGPTAAEKFQTGLDSVLGQGMGPQLVGVEKGPSSRKNGLDLMQQWLSWSVGPDGTVPPWGMPRMRVHRRCKDWIRTVPALPYGMSPATRSDVDTTAEDHAYDDTRYFVSGRPAPVKPKPGPYASSEDAETARRWAERRKKLDSAIAGVGAGGEPLRQWQPKKMVEVEL